MADYGTDLNCVTGLDPYFRTVSGNMCLAQALVRRLSTRQGDLPSDENYGYYLPSLLNAALSESELRQQEIAISNECLKDERVLSVGVTLSLDAAARSLSVTISVIGSEGPFALTATVDQITVKLLSVSPA